jgi:hypothetical protein
MQHCCSGASECRCVQSIQYLNRIFLGETTKFSRQSPKFFFAMRGDVAGAVQCQLQDSFRVLNQSSSGLPPKAATQSGQLTWIIVAGLPTAADCYMILLIKSIYHSLLPGFLGPMAQFLLVMPDFMSSWHQSNFA